MSSGAKSILSVAAAIVIPFAAPAISSALGLSAAIGSATAGSAIVGAGLGAAKSAAFGEDIGRGALMGGIGGGLAGYSSLSNASTAAPITESVGTVPGATGAAGGAATSPYSLAGMSGSSFGATGTGFGTSALTAGSAGVPMGAGLGGGMGAAGLSAGGLSGAMASGLSAGASPYSLAEMASPSTGLTAPPMTDIAPASTFAPSSTFAPTNAPAAQAAPQVKAPQTFVEALKATPEAIAAKFKDPSAMADLTLRAAGMLAGSAAAGSGMSPEEKALLDAQTEELRALQSSNKALFQQKLEAAQGLLGEARYFDPADFGLQSARRAQLAGARAKQAGLRGLTGAAREAEARRADINTARSTGSAYDQGFSTGVTSRLSTMEAGLKAMPTGYPSSSTEYAGLRGGYDQADKRLREKQESIGSLFGSLTGRSAAGAIG